MIERFVPHVTNAITTMTRLLFQIAMLVTSMSVWIGRGSSFRKAAEIVHAKHNQERSGGNGYEAGGLEKGGQDRLWRSKSIGVLTN